MSALLAIIEAATPAPTPVATPQPPPPSPSPSVTVDPSALGMQATATPPPIKDIAPPIDVFPYPTWVVVLTVLAVLAAIAAAAWFAMRTFRAEPAPPPSARSIAQRELRELQEKVASTEPYAFSIAVSDVLRKYIAAEYGLLATRQTSPEFLASIANLSKFTGEDRRLLAAFLEESDMIKFARIDASSSNNERLLSHAASFVLVPRL